MELRSADDGDTVLSHPDEVAPFLAPVAADPGLTWASVPTRTGRAIAVRSAGASPGSGGG